VEHDRALQKVMTEILQDDAQLFKMFADDEGFRRQLRDWVFAMTYRSGEAGATDQA
jgi:type I restriction enzyme R subunit